MKRHLYIPLAVAILLGVLGTGAQAQSANQQRLIANVPFAFSVGKTNLPAGKYTVTVLNPTSDRRILQIRNSNGRSSAMVITTSVIGEVAESAKLVFDRYGDQYFFAQAQLAGDSTSLAAPRHKIPHVQIGEKQPSVITAKKKTVVIITAE
jgi:hypothetical protein